jgi:hypothetical protein
MRKNSKDMSLHHVSWTPAETQWRFRHQGSGIITKVLFLFSFG